MRILRLDLGLSKSVFCQLDTLTGATDRFVSWVRQAVNLLRRPVENPSQRIRRRRIAKWGTPLLLAAYV